MTKAFLPKNPGSFNIFFVIFGDEDTYTLRHYESRDFGCYDVILMTSSSLDDDALQESIRKDNDEIGIVYFNKGL